MAFDSSVVKCFVKEANEIIINSRIDKIHQPQKDELCISLRTYSGNKKLYISANSGVPRIFITDSKSDNPSAPPMFCMLMRKHLSGGKITKIYQVDFERIIVFEIEAHNELMDLVTKKIIVEIMGKHSNIVLTDDSNTIIDSIKRIDVSISSVRQILPGLKYIFPPAQEKINPLEYSDQMPVLNSTDVEKYILNNFYGISKLTAAEIAWRTQNERINHVIKDIYEEISEDMFQPCIIYNNDGTPFDFSAHKINQFNNDYKIEYNSSISYIIETFYSKKALRLRINQHSMELTKIVNNNISRCNKKIAIFEKQITDSKDRDKYMQYGELITANYYKIDKNAEYIDVDNYFDENMSVLRIPLDITISPAKNAQKYFAKYNKMKNAEVNAKKWLEIVKNELEYLESVADEIQRMDSINDLKEIKDELIEQGYIAAVQTKRKKDQQVSSPNKFIFNDYEIYVGKNNKQNDYLTLKIARSQDIWLHTKNIPGSHVIISKKQNEEIPDEVILYAGKLAATYSKAKASAKVAVDYTIVKNVKKPSGAKPGMVIYENYNTIYVSP
jgi:predicted ribosome quality control (RQC) complex YloA/Tae2 family protein